eukprot:CAMPEP_0174702498 /NCGR_PEP_ID=MMETSP1094-20130205/6762_1 /TAXON_ID=156173 /ORGANISM="Chrysochromulina brevifilum, Strain UTEX LB 985" /LENGTH=354 /DNA_ID=CAMNT_0015900277 /DNA_START=62 /DNA_END=1126 /DNA_ORIENTATION=+
MTVIETVNQLAAAIESGPLRKVGFLSQGNYDAVASVLPPLKAEDGGTLEVEFYDNLDDLEAAVVSGDILAAGSTSRPHNDDGHLSEFPSSLITMRAPMFEPPGSTRDSQQLREAIDAAIVRAIVAKEYQRIESKYFASNAFESVAAFTCGLDPDYYPFPPAADATGLLADVLTSKELRIGALGPSNWGYQGTYADANGAVNDSPTGLWPEYLDAILAQFVANYPDITMVRVWNSTSNGVMDDVLSGRAHMTEPYWTVSAYYKGRARSEHLELGCTVLGTESIFFTKGAGASANKEVLPIWSIVVIAVGGAAILAAVAFVVMLVTKEKAGTPMFYSMSSDAQPASSTAEHAKSAA